MLAVYLFALIVGGGLLVFSLIAGDDGGPEAGVEIEGDFDADLDADADLESASAGESVLGGGDWMLLQGLFSLRTLLYLFAGFGATGTLFHLLTDASPVVSFVWAVGTGVVAALAATALYGWVRGTGSGEVPMDSGYLTGATARVLLPVEQGRRGKIVALHAGREVQLLARLHTADDADCPRGSEVVIVDVDGETALVTPLPQLSSESALE